ncbi:MAG: DNRLRE domain-containing protein, partial [Nanoarchaeota archaeon]
MRKEGILLALVVVGLVFSVCVHAETLVLQMNSTFGNDTYISEDSGGNDNYGSLSFLETDSEENTRSERILLMFNLSQIPSGASIENATLELYLSSVSGGEDFNLTVYRLTRQWLETGVTWETYDGVNAWTNPGGDYDASSYDTTFVNTTLGFKSWNLVDLISEYFGGTYENLGFILVPEPLQSGNNWKRFVSRGGAVLNQHPKLTIEYSTIDETPPIIIINSPSAGVTDETTPNLNVTVVEENIDTVWVSLDGGPNVTYAHRSGTIDFGYLDLIFADDFVSYTEGSDGSPTWTNPATFETAVIESEMYKLYNETPIIDALAYITDFDYLNYGGSSKVMVPTGYFGGAYLCPRFGDVNNKYEIALDYDWSSININKVVDGSWSSLGALWTGDLPTPIYVSKDQWHTVGFEIEGNNLSALVDGQVALSVLDSDLNYGGFSLIAYDYEDQHMVYFDDVEMHQKLNYGYHTLRVYANDSSGNENFTIISFSVDSPVPQISIIYPGNESYSYIVSELNYTVFDLNLSSCWYSLDGGVTNNSITCGENVTGLSSGEVSNTWTVWANDTSGNENSSSVTFFVDSLLPVFSNYVENPENGLAYVSGANYEFNVSVSDANLDTVGIEFDGVNYSIYGSYSFNVSDLGAGTYNYYWWANDTLGNYNVSGLRYYSVERASQSITPLLNGVSDNLVVTYPQQVNASYSGVNQTAVSIDISGTRVDIGANYTWGAGGWVVNYSIVENQNYSSYESYLNLTVSQATGQTSLIFDKTSPQVYGMSINASCSVISGEENFVLYRDGVDVTAIENGQDVLLGAGDYNYECNLSETQNYSVATNQSLFTISQATPTGSLTNTDPWTVTYPEEITIGLTESNNGDDDVVYEIFRESVNIGT